AVASKEILVMAGEIVMREARDNDVQVLPVDSEHNAIFQCLECKSSLDVRRIILTASGGPFRETPGKDFDSIIPEQALKHPTWNMGPKITIDSATLFNKGLEMIEAHWLFGVEMKRVEVVIHPQSIVHSLVEFADGSTLAQLSYSDMCLPIQYAITWPERDANTLPPLAVSKLAKRQRESLKRHIVKSAARLLQITSLRFTNHRSRFRDASSGRARHFHPPRSARALQSAHCRA